MTELQDTAPLLIFQRISAQLPVASEATKFRVKSSSKGCKCTRGWEPAELEIEFWDYLIILTFLSEGEENCLVWLLLASFPGMICIQGRT